MSKGLLTKKDLQDAIGWQIISPGFAVDVAKLIDAYEELAAQPRVQSDGDNWVCPNCNALYGGELPDKCIECGAPRQ